MSMEERMQVYSSEHIALLNRLAIAPFQVIEFGESKKPPILSRIALKIIGLQGGHASIRFVDLRK